jgi:hypothetical protein
MMHSTVIKVVGAALVALALLLYLFHGLGPKLQQPPAIHSTLPSQQAPAK